MDLRARRLEIPEPQAQVGIVRRPSRPTPVPRRSPRRRPLGPSR
jgi:hypothetical protein